MSALIVTVNNTDDVEEYLNLDNVDTLIVGNKKFSNRISKSMSMQDIGKCVALCQLHNKNLYVSMTKLFHENELEELEEYINRLVEYDIDGIIFSDFAVYEIVKKLDINIKLSYSTDTTVTNSYFTTLAKENDIDSVFLAKELSLREVKEINSKKETKIALFIHGHIYMYNSYRKLISEYLLEINEEIKSNKFFLYDDERDMKYPIIENENGVNILAGQDLMSVKFLFDILSNDIDYLYIDGYLYEDEEYLFILKSYDKLLTIYKEILSFDDAKEQFNVIAYEVFDSIKNNIKTKEFSSGFLMKETIF